MADYAEYFWLDQQGELVKASYVSEHYEGMIVARKHNGYFSFNRFFDESPYWDPINMNCAEVKKLKAHLLLEGINL